MSKTSSLSSFHARLDTNIRCEVSRGEYLDHMTFRANLRPLFTELFGPLVGLKEEWAAQGAAPGELDLSAFPFRCAQTAYLPIATGWIGEDEEEIIEETDEFVLAQDYRGRLVKLCKQVASLPLPLEYPVKTMDDWLRLKPHYVFSGERIAADWQAAARRHVEAGSVVTVGIPGGFWEPRELMGDAELCMAYLERPELVHEIMETMGATAFRVLEGVSREVTIDQLKVAEDLAGKSGPLIGPAIVQEFIAPYYRRIWDVLAERGARIFTLDSDGNFEVLIPALLDAGVNVMGPMEPAAGMDVVKLRAQYGARLAFQGGIDKHVLRRSKEEIVSELEYKIPPMVVTGGCLIGLDHRIPNGTPLDHYRFYIARAWEIMDREAAALR
jgi:hypothetical protein